MDGKFIPIKGLHINKIVTVDTYENQYLKYMIEMTVARLEELKQKYNLLDRVKDEVFLNKVNDMIKKLNLCLKGSFLNMEEFLDDLIEESSLSSYERSLKQIGHEHYLKNEYFLSRSVLVGSLSNKEQLEINLENKFYHTKLKNVDLDKHLIKTVAIGQSKRFFNNDAGVKYYGKVKTIKIVKRSEIKEIPKESDELYIRFEIEEWKELKRPLKVEGFQVITVLYTTDYLLQHAETVSELCIRNKEEFRLWMELKRLDREVIALTQDKTITNSTKLKGFSFDDKDIYIMDDKIRVLVNGKFKEYKREDFRKNPKIIVKMIKEFKKN